MGLDAFTVLLFSFLLKAVLGVLFLMFWLRGRQATWFAWWSVTFFAGALTSAIFMVHGFRGQFSVVGVAAAFLILGLACCWQAARVFAGRPALWLPVIGAPLAWLAACLVPAFVENTAARIVLSSCLLTPLIAMTAVEFWRGRNERLPSRWPIIVLFATMSLVFAFRIPLIPFAPFPFGALPMQPLSMGLFNLLLFFHTIVLAVLVVAISKERLEFEQRTKAHTDPLTGALNRRSFMMRGPRLLARHRMDREPLALLFIDLDRFKQLNDRHGHSAGDDVLTNFVTVAQDNIRPTDFLFRIGGEEFCCLLLHTRIDEALRVAERIRRQIEAAAVAVEGTIVRATVSLGIASTEAFGYDMETLVRRADMAVYAAKRQGRNRVVVATHSDETGGAYDALADAERPWMHAQGQA